MAAKRTSNIISLLNDHYGTGLYCSLDYEDPWQLLVATILSAQCTDERVNIVTKDLFRKYPDAEAFAAADISEMEMDIRPTGFYHNKARNVISAAKLVVERFDGDVPDTLEELIKIPGVGRKTANVILGNIYNVPSIVVDTHVKRISKRLGLTKEDDPFKIEMDLMKALPREHWILYNVQIIRFGREICMARTPKCDLCFLNNICKSPDKRLTLGMR